MKMLQVDPFTQDSTSEYSALHNSSLKSSSFGGYVSEKQLSITKFGRVFENSGLKLRANQSTTTKQKVRLAVTLQSLIISYLYLHIDAVKESNERGD